MNNWIIDEIIFKCPFTLMIAGPSGAGKTTLLNAINFRNPAKITIEGDVKINGNVVDWKTISSVSGYVQQEDVFLSSLTVKEHLTFLVNLF